MIDDGEFATLKDWVSSNTQGSDPTSLAMLNFMKSLDIEASMDKEIAVLLRRIVAAAFDDAQRQQQAS